MNQPALGRLFGLLIIGIVNLAWTADQAAISLPRVDGVTIDGDHGDWADRGLLVATLGEDAVPASPDRQFAGTCRVGWSAEGMLVAATISSDQPWSEANDERHLYQRDSVELFLRLGSRWGSKMVQGVYAPGLDPAWPEPRLHIFDYRGNPADWSDLSAGMTVVSQATDDGWRLEAVIPWQQLRIEPEPGLAIEFRFNANKIIAGHGRRQLSWLRVDGDGFQRLVLGTEATAPTISSAAWVATNDPDRLGVAAVGMSHLAGVDCRLYQGDRLLGAAPMRLDGKRSSMGFWVPHAAIDPAGENLRLVQAGRVVAAVEPPQAKQAIAQALERVLTGRRWRGNTQLMARLEPKLPHLLSAGPLPEATMGDAILADRAGVQSVSTSWFNADHQPTSEATEPGRYGAVLTVTMDDGLTLHGYHSAVLLDDADVTRLAAGCGLGRLTLNGQRQALAKAADAVPALVDHWLAQGAPYPDEVSARWWHDQRQQLDQAIVYPYAKRLPAGYDDDPEQRWPAIIYLHGSGGRLPSQQDPMADRLARAPERDLLGWTGNNPQPFAIYALQSNGGWFPPAVIDTLDRILAEDRIDPDRVIIMGFSMGGHGTWDVATEYRERFAAAVPLAGGSGRQDQMERLGDLPVWIFNGDVDRTTPLAAAQRAEEALRAAGGDVRLTVLENNGHGGTQNSAFETDGLWDWLLARRRTAP